VTGNCTKLPPAEPSEIVVWVVKLLPSTVTEAAGVFNAATVAFEIARAFAAFF
jgi:hypothetical protein